MELESISKRYGRRPLVLHEVTLNVSPGHAVGISGSNGSGKSTLLRVMVGVARPTGGTITGRPGVIGYVPERFPAGERLSARHFLIHLGRIRGLSTNAADVRAAQLLERLALVGSGEMRTLSKGNLQKVALAQALLVPPELLVLDEPWSGLDSDAHGVLSEILTEQLARGCAVVFSHHGRLGSMPTADYFRLDDGTLRPAGLSAARIPTKRLVLLAPDQLAFFDWAAVPGVLTAQVGVLGCSLIVQADRSDEVLRVALEHRWSVESVSAESGGDQ